MAQVDGRDNNDQIALISLLMVATYGVSVGDVQKGVLELSLFNGVAEIWFSRSALSVGYG